MSYCTILSQINVLDCKYLKSIIKKVYLSVRAVQLSIMKSNLDEVLSGLARMISRVVIFNNNGGQLKVCEYVLACFLSATMHVKLVTTKAKNIFDENF